MVMSQDKRIVRITCSSQQLSSKSVNIETRTSFNGMATGGCVHGAVTVPLCFPVVMVDENNCAFLFNNFFKEFVVIVLITRETRLMLNRHLIQTDRKIVPAVAPFLETRVRVRVLVHSVTA